MSFEAYCEKHGLTEFRTNVAGSSWCWKCVEEALAHMNITTEFIEVDTKEPLWVSGSKIFD